MKTQSIVRNLMVASAVLAFAGAGGETAAASAPIRPHQHFAGLVNGHRGQAVVLTVCPGPAAGHRTGPLKKGQTMEVAKTVHGPGDTGLLSQVYSWFEPVKAGTKPVMLKFSRYGKSLDIPRSVRVPCTGKGKVVFSSCPYLAPCAAGFIQDPVKVKFENIAAKPASGGSPRHR